MALTTAVLVIKAHKPNMAGVVEAQVIGTVMRILMEEIQYTAVAQEPGVVKVVMPIDDMVDNGEP